MKEIKTITLKPYPMLIERFAKENLTLKGLCAFLMVTTLTLMMMTVFSLRRKPTVIALGSGGEVVALDTKITDLQIAEAIRQYLSYRYSWQPSTVSDQLKRAEFFVLPSLIPSYRKAMTETENFVQSKHVTQRVYPKIGPVNWKAKTVKVWADRITIFETLRAATEMNVTLSFALDERTTINPWGIYVTKELEEQPR